MRKGRYSVKLLFGVILALVCVLVAFPVVAQDQNEENLIEAASIMRESGAVQFNFKELDIVRFIQFMSELLQENFVVDPSVKGVVTVLSPRPLTLPESRQAMVTVLEMNGFALQHLEGYSKVVPLKDGGSTGNAVRKGKHGPGFGEELVAQVVPLDFVSATFVVDAVKMSLGSNVGIVPLTTGNVVVLSGKAASVQKAIDVIRAIDVAETIKYSRSVILEHAAPKVVASHLAQLAEDPGSPLAGVRVVADEASRKLVIVGDRAGIKKAEEIITELDVPARAGDFHIYRLQNADAGTVAEQLSQVLAVAARLDAGKEGAMPTTVVADKATNSLVFAAPPHQYQSLLNIIEQMDTQPKQVMIRALIAEVNLTKLKNAGIDWATWGGKLEDSMVYAGQAQLGTQGVPAGIVEWFKDLSKTEEWIDPTDHTKGTRTTYDANGLVYAYVSLLNKYDAMNVLSMPRLLCTDNLESSLQVGQVIPQLKSKVSDVTNPSSVQNSYEYKDTGLILKVTPHVRSGNLVALEIEQSTEDVLSAMTSETPVTAKREIKTNVTVSDGQTVILGGLIKDAEKYLKRRVPGLSYIPLLGNLFTTTVRQREKIDLIVFLTPYIIETPAEAERMTAPIASGDMELSSGEQEVSDRFNQLYRETIGDSQ